MEVPSHSRRSILVTGASVLAGGCLEGDANTRDRTTLDDDVTELPPEAGEIGMAHWLHPEILDPFLEAVETAYPDISIEITHETERVKVERHLADALVDAQPPDLMHTVLGPELARYASVSELLAIPDVIERADRLSQAALDDLIRYDGQLYGIPVTVTPTNAMLAHHDELSAAGVPFDAGHPEEFLESLETAENPLFGMRPTGEDRFRLLLQIFLGAFGPRAYADIADGDLFMEPLREVIDLAARYEATSVDMSDASWEDRDYAVAFYESDRATEWMDDGWTVVPAPGTEDIAALHATGFCLAKRGMAPVIAADVLSLLGKATVQEEMTALGRHLPGVGDMPERNQLAPIVDGAETVLPALSTGCGLDSDRRWRAVRLLAEKGWDDQTVLGDELAAILR